VSSIRPFEACVGPSLDRSIETATGHLDQPTEHRLTAAHRIERSGTALVLDGAQRQERRTLRRGQAEQACDEQVVSKLFPDGKLPKGWLVHIASPMESGWRGDRK
jgi:hypothetical protein